MPRPTTVARRALGAPGRIARAHLPRPPLAGRPPFGRRWSGAAFARRWSRPAPLLGRAAGAMWRALPLALPLLPLGAALVLLASEATSDAPSAARLRWALWLAAAAVALAPVAAALRRALERRHWPRRMEAHTLSHLRALLDGLPHGAITVSATGELRLCNAAAADLLGYAEWQLADLHLRQLAPRDGHDRLVGMTAGRIWRRPTADDDRPGGGSDAPDDAIGPGATWQEHLLRADGSVVDVEITASALVEPDGTRGALLQVHELAEIRRAERRRHLAGSRDAVTNLPDRAHFGQALRRALQHGDRPGGGAVGVLLIDLNGFTALHDRLGRRSTDRLLRAVGRRLSEHAAVDMPRADRMPPGAAARPDRPLLARFGGDEFLLLLPRVGSDEQLRDRAFELGRAFAEPFEHDGQRLTMSATVGGARSTARDTPEAMLRRATEALAAARTGGEGYRGPSSPAVTAPPTSPSAPPPNVGRIDDDDRARLTEVLRTVAAAGDAEVAALCAAHFAVHQFPQVRLGDGQPIGAEAVLRWMHPAGGAIPVEALLGAAGAAEPLGRHRVECWLLERACAAAARSDRGVPVTVAMSLPEAGAGALTAAVTAALQRHELDPARLLLAIDEAEATARPAVAEAAAAGLRALGASTALDRFGLGAAALADVQRLAVTVVRTDPRLLAPPASALDESAAADHSVLRGLAALGTALGVEVLACGVDTPEQLARVREAGFVAAQGAALRAASGAGGRAA